MAARLLFFVALGLAACGPPADHQRVPIGTSCSTDDDCGTTIYKCERTKVVNGKTITYPGGYCTSVCTVGLVTACPSDSICVASQCRRSCGGPSDCRVAEGYACVPGTANGGQNDFCDDPDAL